MITTTEGHDERMAAYLREGRRLHGKAVRDGLRYIGHVLLRLVSRPGPQRGISRRLAT